MFKNPLVLAFIASFFFGGWPIFLKTALSLGPGSDAIIWVGVSIAAVGCIWKIIEGGSLHLSAVFIQNALVGGAIYCVGLILTMLALGSKEGHLALVAPIYNINTLWAMLAGLIYFQEYQKVSVPYAVAGAILITLGGGLTGLAKQN